MPDPNALSPGYNGGRLDFAGAPGADTALDELFPPEQPPAPPAQPVQGTEPQQPPQAPQPFLKAGSSVYNTAEDAARGLEHKDQLVAKYRAFLSENGYDPNELKKQEPQAPANASPSQFKYLGQGKKYYQELAAAANPQHPDPEAYERIVREYQQEVVQSVLAPYAPLMAETARQRAIRQVSSEIPDFQKFVESPEFQKLGESIPLYREMLTIGESNPEASKRLPEVYKMMYFTQQGITKAQAPVATPPQAPVPPTARVNSPTLQPSSMTPPAPGHDTRKWQTDRDARKQLIQDGNARGIGDTDWSRFGL